MPISYGGMAGKRSVTFESDDYYVTAFWTKSRIEVKEYRKDKTVSWLEGAISNIPFVRGGFQFIKPIFRFWKLYIIMFLLLLGLSLLGVEGSSSSDDTFYTLLERLMEHNLLLLLGLSFGFGLYVHFTDMGKYHAAEHMAGNCYDKGFALTVENIESSNRIHNRCGTNLFIATVLVFAFISSFDISGLLAVVLSYSIAYEWFRLEHPLLICPLQAVSSVAQRFLLTVPPKEKHIRVAQASLTRLIELQEMLNQEGEGDDSNNKNKYG